jgi:predicted transposase YbfD/YdcC
MVNATFIKEVSEQLNIKKEIYETDAQWHSRLSYSLVSGHMLAALYNFDDDSQTYDSDADKTVSMQHVLKRGEGLNIAIGVEHNCDYIRGLLIKTGYILHKSNRLTYPLKTIANDGSISFVRGTAPWANVYFSGVGLYKPNCESSDMSIEKMFGVMEYDVDEWYASFEKRLKWNVVSEIPQNVEFLNINDNAKKGYWQTREPKNGTTLCRTKDSGEKEYSIIRITDIIEKSILPSWQTEDGEYCRIAIALRRASNNAPIATTTSKTHTVEIGIDYLLPTAEQNFFELFSWANEENSRWQRTVAIEIYPTLKRMLERLGYKISEV